MPQLRYSRLPLFESTFKSSNAPLLESITYSSDLTVLLYKSPNVYHYSEKYEKKRILLHFTAGSIEGDIQTLTLPDKFVSVPFVIARDGTIYQLFPSKYWAYSLGMSETDGDNKNHKLHKSSIAIELSNIGPLEPKPNDPNILRKAKMKASDPNIDYCTLDQAEAYLKMESPYRGYEYYATFTHAQMASLICLVRWLSIKYDIPIQLLPESVRYQWDIPSQPFSGITSHVNYRQSGKWDIGPDVFDWEAFEQGILAENIRAGANRGGKARASKIEKDALEDKVLRAKVKGVKYTDGVEETIF